MVTSVVARGVYDGSGTLVALIEIAQYNPKMTVLSDRLPLSKLLDGTAKRFQSQLTGKVTITARLMSGAQVRLVQGAQVSAAFVYYRGGKLVNVTGGTPGAVSAFLVAYLAAIANP
jgi:hypothetical protein